MGGVGKSEIALQFVEHYRQKSVSQILSIGVMCETDNHSSFWAVLWIDCADGKSAAAGFRHIAKRLDFDVPDDDQGTIEETRLLLSNGDKLTLLILDNCDNSQFDYHSCIPTGAHVFVIMTTRVPEIRNYGPVTNMKIEGLDNVSTVELLLNTAGDAAADRKAAQQMTVMLGNHPLAIIVGASFVAKGLCSIEEYPAIFHKELDDQLRWAPKQTQPKYQNVHNTFEISIQALEKSDGGPNGEAVKLLGILSFMDRQKVSESMITAAWTHGSDIGTDEGTKVSALSRWHSNRNREVFPESGRHDRLRVFRCARERLAELSLVQLSQTTPTTIAMHPLIHVWAKNRHEGKDNALWSWESALSTLALSTRASKAYHDQTPLIRRHLELSVDHWTENRGASTSTLQYCQMLFSFAYQLRIAGSLSAVKAVRLLHQELQVLPTWPADHNDYLDVQLLRIRCLLRGRDDEEAENVMEAAIPLLSEDPLQRADFLHEHAYIHLNRGRIAEAIELLRKTLVLRECLPEINDDKLATRHELARAYIDDNRASDGREILIPLVEISKLMLPREHPDLLASRHELARARLESGQPQEAEDELRDIVEIEEEQSPEYHPSLIVSQRVLARAMIANNKSVEAEALLLKIVDVCISRFPPNNSNRVESQMVLANACIANGHFRKAERTLDDLGEVEAVFSDTQRSQWQAMRDRIPKAMSSSEQAYSGASVEDLLAMLSASSSKAMSAVP